MDPNRRRTGRAERTVAHVVDWPAVIPISRERELLSFLADKDSVVRTTPKNILACKSGQFFFADFARSQAARIAQFLQVLEYPYAFFTRRASVREQANAVRT